MHFELHLTWTAPAASPERMLIVSHTVFQTGTESFCLCLFGSMPPLKQRRFDETEWKTFRAEPGQQIFGKLVAATVARNQNDIVRVVERTEANSLKLVAERKCVRGYEGDTAENHPTWLQAVLDIKGGKHVPTSVIQRSAPRIAGPTSCLGPWWNQIAITVFEHDDFHDTVGKAVPPTRIAAIQRGLSEAALRLTPQRRRVKFKHPLEDLTPEEHAKALQALETLLELGLNVLEDMREGCTEFVLQLNPEDALRLDNAFKSGELAPLGITEVAREPESRSLIRTAPVEVSASTSNALSFLTTFVRNALRIERFRRPWRRFTALLSPEVAQSPIATVVKESGDRFYGQEVRLLNFKSLFVDLSIGALWWPLLTALLIWLSGLLLNAFGFHTNTVLGISTGISMSLIGSVPCSYVLSPLACTCGAVFIGWAFGTVSSLVLAVFSGAPIIARTAILRDFPMTVNGGIVGLSAPGWRSSLPFSVIAILLLLTAFGIGMSGWLMAQPEKLRVQRSRGTLKRDIAGSVIGSTAGIGIGLFFGLSRLFQKLGATDLFSIQAAFAIAGGAAMILTLWLRTQRIQTAFAVSLIHVIVAAGLFYSIERLAGTSFGFLAVACACSWFQSTWYTLAFTVGGSFSSPRSAIWAAWLEGVVGYTVFVIVRILS